MDEDRARSRISQTLTNYTIAGDSRDAELFIAQFAPDAVLEFAGWPPLPGFRNAGTDAIRGMTDKWIHLPLEDPAYRSATFVRHNLTTSSIEILDEDTARARTYFLVYTDVGPDHAGIYSDDLVRQGERWLFSHRRITLDWRSPESCFPPVKK